LDVTAEDKAIVNTLFSITPKEMWRSVPQPLEGTCDWIVADDTYMKWFWEEKRDNLLWIESPPGYGKSVLARFLVDHHQKRGESVAVCCFFCNSTVEAQSHGTSILRSILHQLFTKNPGMIKHARLAHQTQGPQWVENLATLVTIFENCLEDPNLGNTVIIVDALDEYQDINNPDHLRWILAAMNQSSERQSSLRVILTSRPQPSLLNRLRPVAQLIQLDSVENLPRVKAGLQHFINQEVLDLTTSKSLSDTNRDWLVKKLTAGCQGSFLWVSVAIRSLHEVAGISIGVMEDTLQSPPTELWRMYQNILEKVTFADREWSNHLLQIIVAAYTPPTISQLNFMSAVYQCKGDLGRIPDYIQENFGDTIRNLWGGLVLISDGRACLHHKAMKDFLTDTTDGATTDFGMSHFTENQAKLTMAQNCIWQLKAMKGAQGSISFDFAYAVHNAARHFKEIEHDAKENLFGQLMELYEDESIVTMWRDSHLERARLIATLNLKMTLTAFFEDPLSIPDLSKDVQQWMQNDNLEKNASNVRVASYFGHIRVFRSLLNADVSRYNQVFQDGWTPLCTALDRGQASMVAAILSQGVDVESVSKGQKAIHFAARHSDPKFVQMLLEHQANINSKTGQGATPLSLAAGLGFNNVVEVLLEAKADTQSADLEGDTALHRAARNGHEDVVRVLLLDGAKIEDRNNRGQSPLFIAVQNGKVGVARILLNKLVDEPIDTNHPGILHAAARCGNDDILRLLLDKEIDVKAKDNSGCTPFVYLKADCEPGRIESFLAKGAEINEELQDGTTLLHKAAAQDKISTVQCLLRNGADVKKMTNYGDTPLHLAVSNLGHEEMFKALLDSGAKMEARDDAGNTPFHRAIISWRSQMTLRILKNLGADIEAKNGVGETPLQSAIRKLNAGLVIALIEQHNAHLDVYTSDGMSIIDLADFSYIRLLAEYRVKRNLDFQLPYKLFAVTEVPQMDDNAFQNEKGTLGSVLLKKFELIQLLIKHKMKLDKWRNNISDIKMEVVFTKPYRVEHEATTDPVSAGAGEVTTENTVT
jgi:ankyrin repeat protein